MCTCVFVCLYISQISLHGFVCVCLFLNEIPIILVNMVVIFHICRVEPNTILLFFWSSISKLHVELSQHDMIFPCKYWHTHTHTRSAFTWRNNAYDLWMLIATSFTYMKKEIYMFVCACICIYYKRYVCCTQIYVQSCMRLNNPATTTITTNKPTSQPTYVIFALIRWRKIKEPRVQLDLQYFASPFTEPLD